MTSPYLRYLNCVAAALVVMSPPLSFAQTPWLPARGEAAVSATYQWLDSDRHLFSNLTGPELTPLEVASGIDFQSNSLDFGRVQSHALVVDADVGITPRVALTGSVAFIAPRYRGSFPEPTSADDGRFHPSVQDLQLGVRYMMSGESWAFTPFSVFTTPLRDYEVTAHAAQGLKLTQLEIGTTLGRILSAGGAAKGYVQGAYGYSFVESPIEDLSLNRSRAVVEGGVFLGRFTVQGVTSWRRVHGGLEWSDVAFGHHEHFAGHDQAAAVREWRYGAGLSVEVTPSASIEVSYGDFIGGANTHDARVIAVGWSYGFQLFGAPTIGGGFK